MDTLLEQWAVTYQFHDYYESLTTRCVIVAAESIGQAIDIIGDSLDRQMEEYSWSDYHITSVCIIPELH